MRSNDEIADSKMVWDVMPMFEGMAFSGMLKLPDCGTCSVVWSRNEDGMEHVSVSPRKKFDKLGRENLPTWNDMCILKDVFFGEEEEVYQIHPKKSEYVNIMSNCLHLWKPIGHELRALVLWKEAYERYD